MKVFGITGWKNSGKTTLVAELVNTFRERGYRVSTIKHAHCSLDIDRSGTDSYRHRQAGAHQVLLASPYRWALMQEVNEAPEPELPTLLQHMETVDLVLVEGFKMGQQPKIQVVRPSHHTGRLPPETQPIVALASDESVNAADYGCEGPVLPLNNVSVIADFIADYLQMN